MQVVKDKGKETEIRSAKRQANLVNKECHIDLEPGKKSIPDFRKWSREPNVSPRKKKNNPETKKNQIGKTCPLRGGVDKFKSRVNPEELEVTISGIGGPDRRTSWLK